MGQARALHPFGMGIHKQATADLSGAELYSGIEATVIRQRVANKEDKIDSEPKESGKSDLANMRQELCTDSTMYLGYIR